jgi:hypothetical protein
MIRIYGLNVRSRPAAIALAAAALAVGAAFVAFGIFLLIGLAAVGTVVSAGVLAFRALTGHVRPPPPPRELDPSLEVFPPPHNPARVKGAGSQADKLQ